MSTKIYNGFKIKALNFKEQKAFISDVKKRATEYYLDIYIEGLSRRIVEFVDTLSVLDYNKDFERLGLALKSRYYKRLSISKIISKARLGDIVKVSDEEITKLFQMPHYSLMSFMQDVVEEDIKHCEISKDLFISDFDFNSEIVMFPFTNRNTLLMTYSTNFTNFFSSLCNDKAFCDTYQLEEYHYQNQTDKPDEISARDWNKRKRDWDKVLKTSIPSTDGIVINIIDSEIFIHSLFENYRKIRNEIVSMIPLRSARIKNLAGELALDEYFEIYKKENGIEESSYSDVMDAHRKFKKLRDEGDLDAVNIYNEQKKKSEAIVQNITEDNLFKNSVLSWFPNYEEYLESRRIKNESL